MARAAKVSSVDAIRDFKVALIKFFEEAVDANSGLDMEITRVSEWIEHDRPSHWKDQVRRSDDKLVEARSNLERCQMNKIADETPACRDEKEAVNKAKRNLREAEETQKNVRKWSQNIRHENIEYRGSTNQFNHWLESDYFKLLALLDRIIRTLEDYTTVSAPVALNEESATGGMSRSSDSAEKEVAHPLQKLRKKTPDMLLREGLALQPEQINLAQTEKIDAHFDDLPITIKKVEPIALIPTAKVVAMPGWQEAQDIYIERIGEAADGDSGWFIGLIEGEVFPEKLIAITVDQLLQHRPTLTKYLALPTGFLVGWQEGETSAVLTLEGENVWDPGAVESEEARSEEMEQEEPNKTA